MTISVTANESVCHSTWNTVPIYTYNKYLDIRNNHVIDEKLVNQSNWAKTTSIW